tara:strand:- start:170 stop:1255 length:1086 start_codon:yes stop_codon:yes gene_type:complete
MHIAIIGAGPIGCYAGYLLAKSNHQVSIYEKKTQAGLPIQCTGLLTSDFDQFNLDLSPSLVNTFSSLTINSLKHRVEVQQKEYLVCREKFDTYLAQLAQQAGVKIFFNHSFVGKENHHLVIKNKDQQFKIKPDLVIAADGPLSPVAKAYGFYHYGRKNYLGIQATVEGNFDQKNYHTFFGRDIAPEMWAWVVPESKNQARIGLFSVNNTREYFDKFIRKNNFKIKQLQAGLVPLYHPQQRLFKKNCYLLGDAAGFVKATTLGGIVPGMKQVEILVDCLNNNKNYLKEIKPLKRRLWTHLRIRKILDKFSDQDWNKLLKLVNQQKIKKVLSTHTRDNPIPLVTKTLLKEPRFLYFICKIFYK